MGDSEITSARNYAMGAGGFFKGIDALPLTGQYTHYSLDKKTQKPDYVTDSAASATAWSSGVKTYNGALGVDVFGKDHVTLLELAKKRVKLLVTFQRRNCKMQRLRHNLLMLLAANVTARKKPVRSAALMRWRMEVVVPSPSK